MKETIGIFLICIAVMFGAPVWVEDIDQAVVYAFLAAFGAIISFFALMWMGITKHQSKYPVKDDEDVELEVEVES